MFLEKNEPQQLVNNEAEGEFSVVRRKILQVQDNWGTFYEQLSQMNSPYTEEFQQHDLNFSRAVDKILIALETPTLTLATTGTTSSGKSTLVNRNRSRNSLAPIKYRVMRQPAPVVAEWANAPL